MYESKEALKSKIDWEGGTTDFAFGYGFIMSDLPEDTPGYIKDCFANLVRCSVDIMLINEWLEEDDDN